MTLKGDTDSNIDITERRIENLKELEEHWEIPRTREALSELIPLLATLSRRILILERRLGNEEETVHGSAQQR